MAGDKPGWAWRIPLALLSAVLLALCFEPFALAPLAWIALVPLLLAVRNAPPSTARAACFLFGLAFYGLTLHWLARIFGAAAVALVGILAASSWAFGVCLSLLQDRFGWERATLLAPVAWVGIDLFRSELWYFRFPWMQLGFSQVPLGCILSLASVVGVYGLTLLAVAANVVVARVVARTGLARGAVVAFGVLVLSTLLGVSVQSELPPAQDGVRVGLIQTETSDLPRNLELTRECAAQGARLIAWPEYSIMDDPFRDDAIWEGITGAARAASAYLVVGCKEYPTDEQMDGFYNAAVVYTPGGGYFLETYHKAYPVQFFNDGFPGDRFPTFRTDLGRMGIAICYDMDFAPTFRRLVAAGAEFLVVPTHDAMEWGEVQHLQHAAMARARAVEVRRWVVRPTSSGISQLIDPDGKVHRWLGVGREGAVVGEIEPRRDLSVYVRGGYLLPYACLAAVIAFLSFEACVRLRQRLRGA